jgi:hypothetical protein
MTGDLLFMVPSIQVARLLGYCVFIDSLAELYLAFLHAECAGMLQMVEGITGRAISSMVIVLALKLHCNT